MKTWFKNLINEFCYRYNLKERPPRFKVGECIEFQYGFNRFVGKIKEIRLVHPAWGALHWRYTIAVPGQILINIPTFMDNNETWHLATTPNEIFQDILKC